MEYEVATSSSEDTPFDVKSFALDVIGGDMASPSDDIQTRIYDDTQVLVQRVQDLMSKHVDNRELVAEIEALKRLNEASEQTMGRYRVMGANASTATLTAVPVSATASRYKSLNERLDSNCEQFPDIADVTVEENAKLARILDELEASVRGVAIAGEHRRRGATAIERQQDAKEALQIAVATFQRNVYDIEKLIFRAKNKEFIGAAKYEQDFSVKDLVRVKNQKGTESAKQIAQNAPTMSGDATTEKDANAAAQANVYSQLTAKYGNNKKQETRGRKSLRQIAAGLQKKIEMLKTNQVEMEIFLKRVESHIDDIRGRSGYEIIAENKLAVHEYEPDVRKELLEYETINAHRHEVKQRNDDMVEKNRERVQNNILRKEQLVIARKQERHEQEERERLQATRRRWLALTLIGSRLHTLQKTFREHHLNREIYLRRNHAAIIIQRAWREYYAEKKRLKHASATLKIQRTVIMYLPAHRQRMKHQAANLMREFFQEFTGVSRLMKVIKKYRVNVIMAQNTIKQHLMVRRAQVMLIQRKWDAMEPAWWAQRSGDHNATRALAEASTAKRKVRKSKKKEDNVYHIPEALKIELITLDLLARKKEYAARYWQYRERLAEWSNKFRQKVEMTKGLLTPNFKDDVSSSMSINSSSRFSAARPRSGTGGGPSRASSRSHRSRSLVHYPNMDESGKAFARDVVVPNLDIHPVTGFPKLLNFSVLPSHTDMLQLIELGFVQATNAAAAAKKAAEEKSAAVEPDVAEAEKPTKKGMGVKKSGSKTAEKGVKKAINKSAEKSAEKSAPKSAEKSAEKSVPKIAGKGV